MKKMLFVYNAKSGKALIRRYLADIIDIFVKAGYYVESYPTQNVKDATKQIAQRGYLFDKIVVAGGDGTLNEAVSGMMQLEHKIPLGYIPAGSTNDFAASLKLPKDMIEAAKVAVDGTPAYVDVGTFNKNTFVYVAAFGAFTDVSYSTPQDIKNILGHSAYIVETLKEFGSIMTSHHFVIEKDNGEIIDNHFIYGMVSNSISVAGFRGLVGKGIILDDGLYEVTLIKKPKNPLELQDLITSLLTQKECKNIISFKTSKLKFVSDENVQWVLDGECGGSHKKVYIKNQKRAIKVMSGLEISRKKLLIDKVVEVIKK